MRDPVNQLEALWQAPIGLALFDEQLRYVRVNRALAELNGVAAEDHIGRTVAEVMPELGAEVPEQLRRVRDDGEPLEVEVTSRSGREPETLRHWRISYFPVSRDGRAIGVGAAVVEVTDERRAQARAQRSEEQRRLALRAAELGTWDYDLRTGEVYWDERFRAICGVDTLGMPFPELVASLVHPEDRARLHAAVTRTLDPGAADHLIDIEYSVVWRDGSVHWVHVKGEAFFEGAGEGRRATRFVGTAADITTRKVSQNELHEALAAAERERRRLSEVLEALRSSEARFRSIFEQAAIGIGVVSFTDARWVEVNDTFCRMLGYSREYMVRTPWPEMTHPDDVDLDLIPFRHMAVGDLDGYTVEKRFIHEQGHHVWARLTLSLVRDAEHRPAYEIAIIEDVTDRKRVEEALRQGEERFKTFAETIPHLAFIADAAGNVTYNNGRFFEYFGVDPRNLRGAGAEELPLHEEDVRRTAAGWADGLRAGQPFELEYRLRRSDGQYRWHVVSVAPVRDQQGRISMWVGTGIDVHDQRLAALELQRANERLVQADQRKNEFLAMLSHELRNPLAPVRNSVYILDRAAPGGQQARRALAVIDRQVAHMTRLVDDLLDVTRISRGKIRLQRESLDLGELVRRTAEDHHAMFERTGVELAVHVGETPLLVHGDATRLSQVIGNLLGNAVKFTPRGGNVALSLAEHEGSAVIEVRDDGAGVAPELVGELFDPFVQADQTLDRTRGGLGLGLALVKGLVEMHGGSVSVASEGVGRGAVFTVRLPLDDEPRQLAAVEVEPETYEQARRVLIIEDNTDAAESLKEALELGDHVVDVAGNGPEGIGKARVFKPELILCDIGLPGMDGFEVAKAMRADPELSRTYLVALSGYAAPEDVEKARAAGFDRHVAKPVALSALERMLTGLPQAG